MVTHTMDEDYKKALAICVGVLGVKAVLITLGTVRARLVSNAAYSLEEDKNSTVFYYVFHYVFKLMFLVFPIGPPGEGHTALQQTNVPKSGNPTESVDPLVCTFQACHRNAMEQEPFFMLVAIVYGHWANPMVTWAYALLYLYCICRCLHMFAYLCKLQPWRTIFFVTATTGPSLILPILLLMSAFSSSSE